MTSSTVLFLCLVSVVMIILAGAGIIGIVVSNRAQGAILQRATETSDGIPLVFRQNLNAPSRPIGDKLLDWVGARVPLNNQVNTAVASQLVHAGFQSPKAPVLFIIGRFGAAAVFSLLALIVAPWNDLLFAMPIVIFGVALGMVGPQTYLNARVTERQDRLRKGVPDVLDILVVCVEAGVALDAALQRVAREMKGLHPDLAEEFASMTRRVSAGMSREQALQGLYLNTGLDELRGLASNMIQSEQWGTSIAGVLRVYSDQLRKKRKTVAEKRAATAGTRMLLPLGLFIFPTIFVVLLGPAVIQMASVLTVLTPPGGVTP